jgi:hypothetical protein
MGRQVSAGKRRWPGGASLWLLTLTGGRPTSASGTVVPARAAATRLRKEEDDSVTLGQSGPKLGQLRKIPRKWKTGCQRGLGRKANWAADLISNFISRI